jgi:ABC-type nitrate/sulfonate/bicarbonate transport system ATPase subunit
MSSGVRRRVEIVRALMNDPKALLLDEPYRALDSLTKSVMHEALLEMLRLYALRTGETPYAHRVGDGYDIYRTERADA